MPNGDGTGPSWSSGDWKCTRKHSNQMHAIGNEVTKDEEQDWVSSRIENLKTQLKQLHKRAVEIR